MYEDDDDEPQVDITTLKYVLYVRKSTDDPKRQLRSKKDQKEECNQLAQRLGIRIVKTIEEDGSAKKPGKRDGYKEMIQDIDDGKYNAIISWNPDRLARNMVEGSQILGLVEDKIIQDLRFVTHYFTNDATGKMLLGISFVMADYYSKNLSQNVARGVRKSLKEGKSAGTYKHGYIRGEDHKYHPDGKNFELIRDAWRMRKEGKSLEAIAQYMNENGYGRVYKDKAQKAGEVVKMTDKILSARVFPEPFYYGILIQTNKRIDLRDIPGYDFEPATDEPTYNYVQSLTGRRAVNQDRRAEFKPLRQMVICAYCTKAMYPQAPPGGSKEKTRLLSYRCDTKYCPRKKEELKLAKSIRAKVVFDFMSDSLKLLHVTNEDYNQILHKLKSANQSKQQELTVKIHSKQGAIKSLAREIDERSLEIIKVKNPTIRKVNEKHINELEAQRIELDDELYKLKEQVTDPDQDLISFEDFLNVANNAHLLLRAADVAAKDRIARLIYLNVTVDTEKVVDYQMREPFKTLLKTQKIFDGRGDRT